MITIPICFCKEVFLGDASQQKNIRKYHSLPLRISVQENLRRCYSAALAAEATPRPKELTSLPMPLMVLQPVMKVTVIAIREIDKFNFFIGDISCKESIFV